MCSSPLILCSLSIEIVFYLPVLSFIFAIPHAMLKCREPCAIQLFYSKFLLGTHYKFVFTEDVT